MYIMEDRQLFVSKKIYDYQVEMLYWDRYICGLEHKFSKEFERKIKTFYNDTKIKK